MIENTNLVMQSLEAALVALKERYGAIIDICVYAHPGEKGPIEVEKASSILAEITGEPVDEQANGNVRWVRSNDASGRIRFVFFVDDNANN